MNPAGDNIGQATPFEIGRLQPKDMTDDEARAALDDPYYTGDHGRFMELRSRLVKIDPAYHATKGLDPDCDEAKYF